jgi:hypothetical protein
MPSVLRIETCDTEFTYAWIEADVVRIGSASSNEICIPGIEPILATLIYRHGEFTVINRTGEDLTLGSAVAPPGRETHWPANTSLRVDDQTTLTLLCHADPRPTSIAPGEALPNPEAPRLQLAARKEFQRKICCLIVTCAALFTTAVFVAAAPKSPLPDRWFQEVLEQTSRQASTGDVAAKEVGSLLQVAYSLEKRQARHDARQTYYLIRQRIFDWKARTEGGDSNWANDLLEFVLARIEKLS